MPRTDPARYRNPWRATRTIQEAAALIGCGDAAVKELIREQKLKAVAIGNRLQPTVASLEELLGKPIAQLEQPEQR